MTTDIKTISTTVQVFDPAVSRDFYLAYFDAKVFFDCGWYIDIVINNYHLGLMKAKTHEDIAAKGITFNIEVDDVDTEYQRLIIEHELELTEPLEDHSWGDRGFGIIDPNGINIYIYSLIEPSEEFKASYK